MTDTAQAPYFDLIDELLSCPAGQEPEVLDRHPDLLDADLVRTLIQVATVMAHENQQDSSRFLIFIAKQLAKQLGLYPETDPPAQT